MFLPGLVPEGTVTDDTLGTILLTEDDSDVLTITAEAVRLLGYAVHTATNAAEALAILNGGTAIDILFTDVVMPNGMNGIALAREARRLRPDIRVLLASDYSRDPIDAEEDMDFIAKPYQFPEPARHLEVLMGRAKAGNPKPCHALSARLPRKPCVQRILSPSLRYRSLC
jgi:CheY-like chemotaxis protein